MNSGHGVRVISASKRVSGEPLGVYMGKTTRFSMPSLAVQFGTEEVERGAEVRLAAPALDPVVQVGDHLGQVVLLVREARREVGDGLGHRHDERAHLADVVRVQIDLALGLLQEAQGVRSRP